MTRFQRLALAHAIIGFTASKILMALGRRHMAACVGATTVGAVMTLIVNDPGMP